MHVSKTENTKRQFYELGKARGSSFHRKQVNSSKIQREVEGFTIEKITTGSRIKAFCLYILAGNT